MECEHAVFRCRISTSESALAKHMSGGAVNALLPARNGVVHELCLIKQRLEGSAYPKLAATPAFDAIRPRRSHGAGNRPWPGKT